MEVNNLPLVSLFLQDGSLGAELMYRLTFEIADGLGLLHYQGKFAINALALLQHFAP